MSDPAVSPLTVAELAAGAALAGTVIGWVLNLLMELVRRKWQRADEARRLTIARGDELVKECHELFQWSEDARRKAFEGDVYVPMQMPLFRIVAIVELHYPSLRTRAGDLDTVVKAYREALVGVATSKLSGAPMDPRLGQQLHAFHDTLLPAIGMMLTEARKAVRAELERSS